MRAGMVVGNHRHGGRMDWNIGYSEHGAGRSIDRLDQDDPATVKSRRCEAAAPYRKLKTRAGRPCPSFEEAAFFRSSIHNPPSFRVSTIGPRRVKLRPDESLIVLQGWIE
jgi:hypothetical protein